jgi:formamidopyrimidine-DNA glycosylase
MPELPEVETARRAMEKATRGRRITGVTALVDPLVFDAASGPAALRRALAGRRIGRWRRKGKHLWMELDRRPWLLFHFGMTGSFAVYRAADERPRFWKLELELDDGRRLAYADARRFGRVRLRLDPPREPPVSQLGFDALEEVPPSPALFALLQRRHAPIKAALLDQSLFAGVGNWIADEVLYQAGLRPQRPADELTLAEVRRLRSRLLSVIRHAVACGADAERFPKSWLFHVRWGRTPGATTRRGDPLSYDTVGGRTTAWVPSRQR